MLSSVPPVSPHEAQRLAALESYAVMDTGSENCYDVIADLARKIFDVPICNISLIDAKRQYLKSHLGVNTIETPRGQAFCAYGILQDEALVVPDATLDTRFAQNPLVTGYPHIRFYAGAQLKTPDGFKLGTLCLLDTKPRPHPSAQQIQILEGLAAQVMELFDARRERSESMKTITFLSGSDMRWRRTEKMAAMALEAGQLGFWQWNQRLRKGHWSPRMFQLMGLRLIDPVPSLDEWLKLMSLEHQPTVLANLQLSRHSNQPFRLNYQLQQSDHQDRWITMMGNYCLDENEEGLTVLGVAWDSSESENRLQELQAAKLVAERASRTRDLFLTNMSHELRTPLNGVLGMADLLLETRLDDEQRQMARVVYDAGSSLLAVVNQMLDMNQLQSGKVTLERTRFEWRPMINELFELVRMQADAKSLQLAAGIEQAEGTVFVGDAGRIQQILLIYLQNALKFTLKGGVSLNLTVQPLPAAATPASASYELLVSVRDSGPGIAKEHQVKLFQPFSQVDDSITRQHGGVGLGLAIARRLAESMNGSVGVISSAGQGATFWLRLTLDASSTLVTAPGESDRNCCQSATSLSSLTAADKFHRDVLSCSSAVGPIQCLIN